MSGNLTIKERRKLYKKRQLLCKECDFVLNYNDRLKRTMCGLCGCQVVRKIQTKCPAGKW